MNAALIPVLGTVGPTELIIILTIVLLLFGAKKIPELARGLGTGVREFKRGTTGAVDNDEVRDRNRTEALAGGGDEDDSRPEGAREESANAAAERAARRTEQQQR